MTSLETVHHRFFPPSPPNAGPAQLVLPAVDKGDPGVPRRVVDPGGAQGRTRHLQPAPQGHVLPEPAVQGRKKKETEKYIGLGGALRAPIVPFTLFTPNIPLFHEDLGETKKGSSLTEPLFSSLRRKNTYLQSLKKLHVICN